MKDATIGYLLKQSEILLAYKKKSFGKGLYNGFGGKVEEGESFEQCMIREAEEEIGINPLSLEEKADFVFHDIENPIFRVKIFFIDQWLGDETETEEMKPEWFSINSIPYEKMWEADQYWLPRLLNGEKLKGEVHFDLSFEKPKLLKYEFQNI